MTTRPYELLVRFSQDGAVAGAHIRTITSVNGRDYESDPIPLASTDDPAFTDFASQFSAVAIAEKESVKTELEKLQSEYNSKVAEVDSANVTIAQLQARIAELTAPPPNPFPDADWANFRFAILADEAIQRVAAENSTAWPLMVLYLSQLDTNPARGLDIAALWNFMEAHSAVSADEITRINAIAAKFSIPLALNDQGQFE